MPRYVVLRHDAPHGVHFDLMLETNGALTTWSLPQRPSTEVAVECEALGDHRLEYLSYEGPISGGRGTVTCWDRGHYTVQVQSAAEWRIVLAGEKLRGGVQLQRLAGTPDRWTFSLHALDQPDR